MAKVKLSKKPPKPSVRLKKIYNEQTKPRIEKVLARHEHFRDKATKHWSKKNKPKFKRRFGKTKVGYYARLQLIAPNARQASISVYRLVVDGTRVRHAVMSTDFIRKSHPGVIFSRPGRGRMVYVSKKVKYKGIEARNFDNIINNLLEPDLWRAYIDGYRAGFRSV